MNELEQARALFLEGLAQLESKAFSEAESNFRRALALAPGRVSIITNLSAALLNLAKFEEAGVLARQAISLDADNVQAMLNLALCQTTAQRHEDALATLDAALSRIATNSALAAYAHDIFLQRGNVFCDSRRYADALDSYDKAIFLQPGHVESWLNRGTLLRDLKRHEEAMAAFREATRLAPRDALVWQKLGLMYHDMGDLAEAVSALERAHALSPSSGDVLGKLLISKMHACDWREFDQTCAQILSSLQTSTPPDVSCLLAIDSSAQQQHECMKRQMDKSCPAVTPAWDDIPPYQHQRLRIGYFSSDYHEHATAYLMIKLFETHDRTRFETIAFSFGRNTGDTMRLRLEKSFDQFIDVRDKSDKEIAYLARALEIDIAIDLKGLTVDSRPRIFSYRLAPVQVSYLGYPGSMGTEYFDYLIADQVLVPAEQQCNYTEKIVYMPDSYQVNDSSRRVSSSTPTRAECGLPDKGFVFCCFNNNYKITPDVFEIWMGRLKQVPGSVLWLIQNNVLARENLLRAAQERDIDPDRLVFAQYTSLDMHLARHAHADLFLDTFYYNAHTTCSDALWTGLPVVTCMGKAFPSRVAASLLHAVNMPQLVTHTHSEYAALALELARDTAKLAQLRKQLRPQNSLLPLFDTQRFTRNLESAYEAMHELLQAGLAPDHLYPNNVHELGTSMRGRSP